MLEALRKEIFRLTRDRKTPATSRVCRTFYLLLSEPSFGLRDWFCQWFPVHDEVLDPVYPWLLSTGNEDEFKKAVEEAVRSSMDVGLLNTLAMRGISIVDSYFQIIVVADLWQPEARGKVERACESVQNVLNNYIPNSSPYWIGLFNIRGYVPGDKKEETCVAPKESLRHEEGQLFMGRFSRAFLFDIANGDTLIRRAEDQYSLAGQLLYYLSALPAVMDTSSKYADWVQLNSCMMGMAGSGSAFSIVLPVDRILEGVCVSKGAEVIESSLLTVKIPGRDTAYFHNFRGVNFLLQAGDSGKALMSNPEFPMENPTEPMPQFVPSDPDSFLAECASLDESLVAVSKTNALRMAKVADICLLRWRESLEEHLEGMIMKENGGLLLAQGFLKSLKDHLEFLIPKKVSKPVYGQPATLLEDFRRFLAGAPRNEALVSRGLVLVVLSLVAALATPSGPLLKNVFAYFFPVLSIAVVGLSWHTTREKTDRKLVEISEAIRKKWAALMVVERASAEKALLEKFLPVVVETQEEVEQALQRTKKLVGVFRDDYEPPQPQDFAFWKYILRDRKDLIQQKEKCRTDVEKKASEYLTDDSPLRLWRRLSAPDEKEISPAEWELIEKAAQRVLPDCGEIRDLHVLDFLKENTQIFNGYRLVMTQSVKPFLVTLPDAPGGRRTATIEAADPLKYPVVAQVITTLKKQFDGVTQQKERSRYRMTLFGFLDGVRFEDVSLGQGR